MASRQPNSDIYLTLQRFKATKPSLFRSLRKACLDDKSQARGNGRFIRLSKKFPKLLGRLQELCPNTPVSIIERTIRFMRENKCEVCGEPCLWFPKGPLKFCSNKCCKVGHTESGFYKDQAKKRVAYYQENFGVNGAFAVKEIRDKSKATMMERYGADNPLKVDSIKEKVRLTNNTRYRGNSPSCSLAVKQKQLKALESKYGEGVINPSCIPGMKNKKRRNSMRRHGVAHANMLPEVKAKIKATYRERTGYDHQMHNPEVIRKINLAQHKVKEWVDQFGNIHECRGCEPTVLSALEDAGAIVVTTDFGDMPDIRYRNPIQHKSAQYQPDALVVWKGEQIVVEAKQYDGLFFRKNEYTRNKAKFEAANRVCGDHGMQFMLAIHDKKKIRIVRNPTYQKLESILFQKFPDRFDETI